MTSGSVTPLPCPFCGKQPEHFPSGMKDDGLMIQCITPNCVNPHVSYIPPATAIQVWNTRVNTHPALVKALEEAKKKFQFVYENDLTQYEHHQPRRDGKRPSDTPEKGTIWRTPREIAKAEIINIDAALTAAKASGKE